MKISTLIILGIVYLAIGTYGLLLKDRVLAFFTKKWSAKIIIGMSYIMYVIGSYTLLYALHLIIFE